MESNCSSLDRPGKMNMELESDGVSQSLALTHFAYIALATVVWSNQKAPK